MDLTFTGRGFAVTDDVRELAERKLSPIARLEPRTTRIDLEFVVEQHPRPDGTTRVQAALHIPRKTFRAEGEAEDAPTALDRVAERLERQIRDHHGRRRKRLGTKGNALESARPVPGDVETSGE